MPTSWPRPKNAVRHFAPPPRGCFGKQRGAARPAAPDQIYATMNRAMRLAEEALIAFYPPGPRHARTGV